MESDLELEQLLGRIVEAAKEVVGARYGALGILDPNADHLEEFITSGIDDDTVQEIGRHPTGQGVLGLLIANPRPVRIADVGAHSESFGFPPAHPVMHSFLGVPIVVRGTLFGNLYLTDKTGAQEFTAEDEEVTVALAAAAGIAIDNARLLHQVRDLAVLADRQRIARDLHDTVIQRLFATGLSLQATARMIEQPTVVRRIDDAVDDLDQTIRQIRTTIFGLEDTERGLSLRSEILQVLDDAAASLGFEPTLVLEGPIDSALPIELSPHLLATLREALSNVSRHARATAVEVRLAAHDGILTLYVADDGIGVPPNVSSDGHGLMNIAARAALWDGSCSITRRSPAGTMVEWRVPYLDDAR